MTDDNRRSNEQFEGELADIEDRYHQQGHSSHASDQQLDHIDRKLDDERETLEAGINAMRQHYGDTGSEQQDGDTRSEQQFQANLDEAQRRIDAARDTSEAPRTRRTKNPHPDSLDAQFDELRRERDAERGLE
jgi:hypothetical protein